MTATRQVYWNIEGHLWLYVFFILALMSFGYGVYRRVKLWNIGEPENRWQDVWQGIKDILVYGFGHKRILRDGYPGVMHFTLFWGFVFLTFATAMITLQADFGLPVFHGELYLLIKFTANLFGLAALIGILMAYFRRYVLRPSRLDNKADDVVTLSLIFAILVTGFFIEGTRMAVLDDPWAMWGFAGAWISVLLKAGFDTAELMSLHRLLWWIHLLLTMVFIAYLPYSKLFHLVLAPLNQFFRKREPVGIPSLIDFEDESVESYGINRLPQFSWKVLYNTDACLRCGRCQDNCPAYLSGKSLNPKQVIQDLRGLMEETGTALAQAQKEHKAVISADVAVNAAGDSPQSGETLGANQEVASTADVSATSTNSKSAKAVKAAAKRQALLALYEKIETRALIGDVIPEEVLWACTTCRSCEEQCPIFVEHVDKTIDMRRNLVLTESRFPQEAQLAFRNMENNGNPWGIGWSKRSEYLTSLGVPTIEENPEAEILYWPGCSGAFDARNQKVASALTTLFKSAGVNFAILGNEEKCCGDSARKLGNEFLFQMMAAENIEVMKGYGVKKIVTQCPHCFNMLKNEYPQLGGDFEVIHHTAYLKELLDHGKLKLAPVKSNHPPQITFHDSCYLGRYNQIYTEPRQLLQQAGFQLVEMEKHGSESFCCGAGGGRMWLEEHGGQRINEMRTDQALATGAELVGTACPFCLTMFNDGINAREAGENVKALDVAEILVQAI